MGNFWLVGAGAYIVSGPYDYDDHHDYDDDYNYDTIFGGYWGAGIHYNITPRIFVGVEGKYLWTDKVKLKYEEFRIDGIIATAVIGIRF